MNFVSHRELYQDVLRWERTLPVLDAVCGIPRSGILPAGYLALRRNIRLADYVRLRDTGRKAVESAYMRSNNPAMKKPLPAIPRVLVVDDSISENGVTLQAMKRELASLTDVEILFGAVYRASDKFSLHSYRLIPMPRIFEWNWFRHRLLEYALLDMDGVICEDWFGHEEEEPDKYLRHLEEAPPLYLPEIPVMGIVTGRLEKYRRQTEDWLKRHGVGYAELHMYPGDSPVERRSSGGAATRKGKIYASKVEARLFVESNDSQAKTISQLAAKPVLSLERMRISMNGV